MLQGKNKPYVTHATRGYMPQEVINIYLIQQPLIFNLRNIYVFQSDLTFKEFGLIRY